MKAVVPWILLLVAAEPSPAAEKFSEFETHTFTWANGAKLPFRLLKPETIEPGTKYPLVLSLHGWGDRGTDNEKQLKDFAPVFLKPDARKRFPCFLLVPQTSGSWVQHPKFDKPIALTKTPTVSLAMTFDVVRACLKKYPVDHDRLYLTGYSNGACGVWELLEREPRVWAAAAPLAGAGDPSRIGVAKHVAVWAFHGAKDPTIPEVRMMELVDALRAAHGDPLFTIYPNGVHYDAMQGLYDRNFLPWMFAQRRGKPTVPFDKIAGPKDRRPTSLAKKT
jgi:predicted peptidase